MIRTLKLLGLVAVVIGAFSAISASGASAETLFHCEVEPCISTGTTEPGTKEKFAASGFTVECHGEFASTSLHKTETTILVDPRYSNCESSLGAATVDTAGCYYVFTSHTNATGHLSVSVACTNSTESIKVTAPGCTLSFGPQATKGGVKATNLGSGPTRDITLDTTSEATFSKSGSFCFAISGDTGLYSGTSTVTGYTDNASLGQGCTGLPDQSFSCTEGVQAGIWWE